MPAIQFSGLASGLDTDSIIGAIMQVERIPNQRLEQQNRQLQSQSKILDNLTSSLSDLASKAKALESTQDFLSFSASSSDEKVAKLAVSGFASRGSYDLQVHELSSAQRNYSQSYATAEDVIIDGGAAQTLTMTINGKESTITLESGETLENLVAKINRSGAGVSAGIFKGADGARLQIAGNKTGAENAITFGGDLAATLKLDENLASEAKDARASLDGFEITSSTNVFGEVMPGVSLEVFKAQEPTDAPVSLTVTPNQSDVQDKVKDFIKSYNSVVGIIRDQSGEGKGASTLSGDSTVRMIESRLRQALSHVSSKLKGSDGEGLSLASIGFKTDSKLGTLSLDSSKFKKALDDDFEGSARHFAGHADPDLPDEHVQGLSGRIMAMVADLTGIKAFSAPDSSGDEEESGSDGSSSKPSGSAGKESLIGARKEGIAQRIRGNEDRIASRERYLESYENQLRMQYAALEEMMSQLNAQGNYLGQFGR